MKKLFKNVATSVKATAVNIKSSVVAFNRRAVCGNAGEGYIDTAVKVLIAVVLGALVLAGLYAILNDTVMPTVTQKITEMFSLGNAGGHLLRQDNALPMQCRYTHEAILHTGYPDGTAHYADRGETTNAWRQAD